MLVTRPHRSNCEDVAGNIRIHTSEDPDKVIEFSEASLPADLFVPPREFRRVRRLLDEVRAGPMKQGGGMGSILSEKNYPKGGSIVTNSTV